MKVVGDAILMSTPVVRNLVNVTETIKQTALASPEDGEKKQMSFCPAVIKI